MRPKTSTGLHMRLKLFGDFVMRTQRSPKIKNISKTKQKYIGIEMKFALAYLIHKHPERISVHDLNTILDKQSSATTSTMLSRLKEKLLDYDNIELKRGGGDVWLEGSLEFVDLTRFKSWSRPNADPVERIKAIKLYRDPLLTSWSDTWIENARNQYEREVLRLLGELDVNRVNVSHVNLTGCCLRRAMSIQVVTDLPKPSQACNIDEALAKRGNKLRDLAEAKYFELLDKLSKEYPHSFRQEANRLKRVLTTSLKEGQRGVSSPINRLQVQSNQMLSRLKAETDQFEATAEHGLIPKAISTLVERPDDIAEIVKRVKRSRLVTIHGHGGMGKSRLAQAAAERLGSDFHNGVWFIELPGHPIPQNLSQDILLRLKIIGAASGQQSPDPLPSDETDDASEAEGPPYIELLQQIIGQREMLLILDNCESMIDQCRMVIVSLLERCQALKILVTSRQPMAYPGEDKWEVPPLTTPHGKILPSISELMKFGAVRLFVQRAKSTDRPFELTSENATHVVRVCRTLEGHALAIELAAALVREGSPIEWVASNLDKAVELLTFGASSKLDYHQSLLMTIEWSYNRLQSDAEKELFGQLWIFHNTWDDEAARRICSLKTQREIDFIKARRGLENISLIQRLGEETVRYRMQQTIQQYSEHLTKDKEEENRCLRLRHVAYYLRLVDRETKRYSKKDTFAFVRLDNDYDNIRAAIQTVLDFMKEKDTSKFKARRIKAGLQMIAYMRSYLDVRGFYEDGLFWSRQYLEHPASTGFEMLRLEVLNVQATCVFRLGNYKATLGLSDQMTEMGRALRSDRHVIIGLNLQASALNALKRFAEARERYEEALHIIGRSRKWRNWEGIVRGNLGNVLSATDMDDLAEQEYDRALTLIESSGLSTDLLHILNGIGRLACKRDNLIKGSAVFRRMLVKATENNDKLRRAYALEGLAHVARRNGDYEFAARLLNASEGYRDNAPPSVIDTFNDDWAEIERVLGKNSRQHLDEDNIEQAIKDALARWE